MPASCKEVEMFCFCLGATLEIITDRSQEGAQFVKGFGGIGGEDSIFSVSYIPYY